ncbi:MAG: hypothetical protein FJ100_07840 [Deltaproteobacteria bacterium]|nr:hypothetical protein [Deltaproteobacteria bacterium]
MASADKLIVEVPKSAADFRLPPGVSRRLQTLLDKQDRGVALTRSEREEAEGLVALVDWLALIRVRTPSEG